MSSAKSHGKESAWNRFPSRMRQSLEKCYQWIKIRLMTYHMATMGILLEHILNQFIKERFLWLTAIWTYSCFKRYNQASKSREENIGQP
uniref:Ovule protein n=1 Tax=Steinernema glaseri TaxID=37863 RepID=A0A1I7XX57_9BILA